MSDTFDWDRYKQDDRISFDNVGDEAVGVLVKVEHRSFSNGDAPQLTLKCNDGVIRTLVASKGLQNLLAEQKPNRGDKLRIKLTELKHTGQPSPFKVFSLDIKRGAEEVVPTAAASAAAEDDDF